jgi:TonB family protein
MVHRERSAADRRAEAKGGTLQKSFILDFVKSSGVEITGENDISVDGRAAHEFKLRKGAATGVARVILSGRDAYSILVLTVLSEVDPKNIARFLESFKLIEKSQKDAFSDSPPPPPPPPAPDRKDAIRVSGGVLQALGTKKVEPEYPPIAKVAGAEGVVNIRVTVSEEGRVVEAEVIDGHPLLRDAALQAARQWEFKPTELPSKPVKVIGVLTFNFTLK